jgi:hypothetical protein
MVACLAVMLGVSDMNIPRATGIRVPDVVEHSLLYFMSGCFLPAFWTRALLGIAAFSDNLGLGKIRWREDILSGVRGILANGAHSNLPSEHSSKG